MTKKNKNLIFFIVAVFLTQGIPSIIDYYQRKDFYEKNLTTKIISERNNISMGRTKDFITKEGIVITLRNSESQLQIADSVVKKKNSWQFDAYRYNEIDRTFIFFRSYDLEK